MLDILVPALGLLLGLAFLVRGADLAISGAKKIGTALGMSPLMVGVLIVGVGTALPELVTSLIATISGHTDVAVATVVGSNIVNILLVLGLSALVGRQLVLRENTSLREISAFAFASTLLVFVLVDGVIDTTDALLFLGVGGAYCGHVFRMSRARSEESTRETALQGHLIGFVVGGLALLALGAKISIDTLTQLGFVFAIPPGIIAITVLAVGTSLPELVVSVRAAYRGENEIALGNILGSNVFNTLFVLGISGLIAPLSPDVLTQELGIPVMVVASVFLFALGISKQVLRWEGIAMLLLYAFFVAKLVIYL